MTEAPPLSKIVDGFAAGAQAACALLDTFQPDLVLVLMHSGVVPLRVTQALWEMTRATPFPPVVATNLGREKVDYFTQKLVEALLTILYPEVEIRCYANFANAWCDTLGQLWLRKLHPEVYRPWWHLARAAKMEGRDLPLYTDLCLLVPGTEDVAPDSLDWQPITAHSSLLERLLAYLPAEEWLTLPAWAEATLIAQVMATVLA